MMFSMKTTASKKAIRATVKALRAEAGEIRAQWAVRGVAAGEFEKVKGLEQKAWEIDCDKVSFEVDSLYR
jgi:hypothetical protein